MEVGAIQVPVNPQEHRGRARRASSPRSTPRLSSPTRLAPTSATRRCSTRRSSRRADGRGPADVDPDDVAVMIPTSGTTGRSKLVMQTHLAYVMAGEGFPYWLRAHRRRPADDLAAAVPHQRARVLDARLGRRPAPASCCCPAFSASTFLDSARRYGATEFNAHRGDARDPHAPARAARRRRQPAAPLLHGPVARPGAPARDRGAASGFEIVLRLRAVGDARTA